jgi:hypothetical protein
LKRARRAAGVKAERFTYASVRMPPAVCRRQRRPKRVHRCAGRLREGKAVHALAVLEGLAGSVFVSKTPARSSVCAATWTKPHKIRRCARGVGLNSFALGSIETEREGSCRW